MPEEIWKPVVGFEGVYSVSSLGRVRRDAGGSNHAIPGKIISAPLNKNGYVRATLCKEGEMHDKVVHRLVAEAFLGRAPSSEHQVAHGNGVGSDNRPKNLRWATARENQSDRVTHGTTISGERHRCAKLTRRCVIQIRGLLAKGASQSKIASSMRVAQSPISRIKLGHNWKEEASA